MSRWVMHDVQQGIGILCPWVWSSPCCHHCCLRTFADCWARYALTQATTSQNIVSHHHTQQKLKAPPQLSLGVRKNKDHRDSAMSPQEWPQFLFQCKLHFGSLFTTSKEQTKEYILFSGLGACLWSTFHCLERTCSARFSHCSGHSLGSALQSLGRSTGTFSKPSGLEGL